MHRCHPLQVTSLHRYPTLSQFYSPFTELPPPYPKSTPFPLPTPICFSHAQVSPPLLTSLHRCPTYAEVSPPCIGVTSFSYKPTQVSYPCTGVQPRHKCHYS